MLLEHVIMPRTRLHSKPYMEDDFKQKKESRSPLKKDSQTRNRGWGDRAGSGRRGRRHTVSILIFEVHNVFMDSHFQTFCGSNFRGTRNPVQHAYFIVGRPHLKFHELNFCRLLAVCEICENREYYAPQKFGHNYIKLVNN